MKIALLGYGKMGHAVEQLAVARGHDIVLKVTGKSKGYDIQQADVAIDFSVPAAAYNNISNCLNHGVAVVSGTTGWLKDYDSIISLCQERDGAFIYASNFSLGVNVFFELNKQLAKMMADLSQYKVGIKEIHHSRKQDAPSGTAISLAEGIIEHSYYNDWKLSDHPADHIIPIKAHRVDDIPGTHIINYESDIDTIQISHEAFGREGFALGAVIAAEWIKGKSGVFTMKDVLNIG